MERARAYLDESDFIPSWVSENYDIIADDEVRSFISVKDLFVDFKASEQMANLSKREARALNETKFRETISKSNQFKHLYREAKKVKLDAKQYNSKDGFVNLDRKSDGPASKKPRTE